MKRLENDDSVPARVLQVFSTLNNGGAENRIMDVFRHLDQEHVLFDFSVVHPGEHFFTQEILRSNSRIYCLPDPRSGLIRNYFAWRQFFAEHRYAAVHTHVSWYGGLVLLAAKRAGIPYRVAHARGTEEPGMSLGRKAARALGRFLFTLSATSRLAISEEAAKNIFGPACVKARRYQYVPNSIDCAKYLVLDGENRTLLRNTIGIPSDAKAYVTVANFRKPKNHLFLLDIADELRKRDDSSRLYLIGDGELRDEIRKKIERLGLQDTVCLLGPRGDVPSILCAFDGMIFPSLFEGLGGVVLEAQIVGVPAFVSTAIPKEADVGIHMVEFLSLEESPAQWAETIIRQVHHVSWDRETALRAFQERGYSIENTAEQYLKAYGLSEREIAKAFR